MSVYPQVDSDKLDNNLNKIRSTSVRISQINDASVRMVLHKDVTDEDADAAVEKIKYVIGKIGSR